MRFLIRPRQPLSEADAERVERVLRFSAPLLAIMLLLLGLVTSYRLALSPLYVAWRATSWQEVPAVIDRVQFVDGYSARLLVSYHYWIGDQVFRASRYGVHDGIDQAGRLRDAAARMYRKQQVMARVNPADPSQSLLDPSPHWGVIALAVPALLLALAGALLLWLSLRGWQAARRAARRLAEYEKTSFLS